MRTWAVLAVAAGVPCLAGTGFAADAVFKDGFECAALPATNVGCEFYAVPLANTLLPPGFGFGIVLVNSSSAPATVVISGGGLGAPLTLTVPSGGSVVARLPWVPGLQTVSATVLVGGGAYHVKSDRPLAAYQMNPLDPVLAGAKSYTDEGSLLLPVHALSGSYRVTSWPSWESHPGYFAVVGTEDGTLVSVAPGVSGVLLAGAGLSASGGTVTLNRGDVLQVLGPTPGAGHLTYGNDLSGSVVTADKRVAVFGGHDLSYIPATTTSADHLEEQLAPVQAAGSDVILAVPAGPLGGPTRHTVKVMAVEPNTTLTYVPPQPGAPSAISVPGQFVMLEATGHFRVIANHPIVASQYLEGQNGVTAWGDPAMGMVLPSSQFRTQYTFAAPAGYSQTWVTIVAPAGEAVTLDGGAVDPTSFTTVTGTGYAVARLSLGAPSMVHQASAAAPIGVYSYGYALYTSYLFPAGMGLEGVPADPAPLAPWSTAVTDGGDLRVSAGAAMKATATGLEAAVNDTAGIYVEHATSDESRYRARFYFDPHDFDPGEGQGHHRTRIFIVFESGPTRRLAAVVLRRIGGAYALMARARLDDNSQADTPFFLIAAGPHVVEIDWRQSSAPDALDGSLQLWIDGTSQATLSALDNSRSSVDFVRMGALSVKTGSSGSMYWDEFESRRATYIGP